MNFHAILEPDYPCKEQLGLPPMYFFRLQKCFLGFAEVLI